MKFAKPELKGTIPVVVLLSALTITACAGTPAVMTNSDGPAKDKVVETFDSPRLSFQLKNFESSDGPAISSASVKASLGTSGGVSGSGSLRIAMEGKLSGEKWNKTWDDSYLFFHTYLQARLKTGESRGLLVSLNPQSFNTLEIGILQEKPDGEHQYSTTIVLPEGVWSTVRLPWEIFEGSGPQDKPDMNIASSVVVHVPWLDNWKKGYFRGKSEFQATLLVDNLGSWQGSPPPGRYDFEPDFTGSAWDAEVYGIPIMVEDRDNGDPDVYETPGIRNLKLSIETKRDDTIGSFLSLRLQADLDESFKAILDKHLSMGIGLHGRLSQPFGKADLIGFQAKASESLSGNFQYTDIQDDWRSYGASLSLNDFWSKVDFPFSELKSDDKSPSKTALERERPRIDFGFDLPEKLLKKAFTQGKLDIVVDIDDIVVE